MSSPSDSFDAVVAALQNRPGVTRKVEGGFGHGGLFWSGKLFATVTTGGMLVKLPAERVSQMIDAGHADPFTAGKSRPMREWAIARASGDWPAIAAEALAFVSGSG